MSGVLIMNIQKIIKEKIDSSLRGTECFFIKVSDKIGAKIFFHYSEDEVKRIYKEHEYAAQHNLAPDIYDFISVEHLGKILYGYLTEIVKVFPGKQTSEGIMDGRKATKQEEDELDKLICELDSININPGVTEDLHFCNIGWKNRKMICIDFGYLKGK